MSSNYTRPGRKTATCCSIQPPKRDPRLQESIKAERRTCRQVSSAQFYCCILLVY